MEERPTKIQKCSHDGSGASVVFPLTEAADGILLKPTSNSDESHEHDKNDSAKISDSNHIKTITYSRVSTSIDDSQNTPSNTSMASQTHQPSSSTIPAADPTGMPLSKNAQKRLLRAQKWDESRAERKAFKKQKDKERKERKRQKAALEASNPLSNTTTTKPAIQDPSPDRKRQLPTQLPVTFIFDCDFDSYMNDKELVSLTAQVTRSYSDNKHAKYRAHMCISSFSGRMKERLETVMMGHYKGWKGVRFFEEDFVKVAERAGEWMRGEEGGKVAGALEGWRGGSGVVGDGTGADIEHARNAEEKETQGRQAENIGGTPRNQPDVTGAGGGTGQAEKDESDEADEGGSSEVKPGDPSEDSSTNSFPQGETIYLTADSPNILTHLTPFSTYIFGAIVDKNRYKGLCYKRALDNRIKTARLPIGQYMKMNSRKVLTTNHVNEIMLKWFELGDWGAAFMSVIPKRKGGELLSYASEHDGILFAGENGDDGENSEHGEVQADAGEIEVIDGDDASAIEAGQIAEKSADRPQMTGT
ncbi:hypothetical protein EJ05DRAFT_473467 [Pseudovirgaria hyperparasitica]|uniref:tRNA (guanine(9)-N1)-methyltransferase n=1 Tax=Pseudovirgaria hyperparasitica TaxID=470096 RepID=A0A6A6WIB2_9PEZI|nr:uncharacterized protein EJ05DRAFT_473467 [Pseudovirgaria hyperparasitica]KAF2760881.1 hypothetical protein EJ05DRAFT_473467 [Pseudovirgaria hyperparasitica]